ncbi:putative inactive deoxyuridine 5'-triphosphate nucleotidohydrolase-like protein FLJ16323 isoform X2 [Pan troglodytes]|uniref:putative inactive deoxyuridine 5'-triphosphate nucleotidohydrolase-like protein FLJ16323 isoform X2 n=1 Tax=Pan troglodytes TaxID=9598 RepID=UPI003013DA0F
MLSPLNSWEVLVPKGGMLPPRDTTTIPLNWKLRLPPGHFVLLLPSSQQAKKGVTVLAVVIDLDYQDEISLLLHNRGKMRHASLSPSALIVNFLRLPQPCGTTKPQST